MVAMKIPSCFRYRKAKHNQIPSPAPVVKCNNTVMLFLFMAVRLLLWVGAVMTTSTSMIHALQSLQTYHPVLTPSDRLRHLADYSNDELQDWDVYGDFDQTAESSYLRDFESELATELCMEDGVFMPSGVMAQGIALLIHGGTSFACHPTSHLLLHEQDAYRHLLNMEAIAIHPDGRENGALAGPPLLYEDVARCLQLRAEQQQASMPGTLMIELPHREIGGQLSPWEDVLAMRDFCQQHAIRFHCDGARLFEAAAGYNKDLSELASPFDSVYISMYKGLGGLAGGVLLGTKDFCAQARVWLRRFGGNLYTVLPYAAAGRQGYDAYWKHTSAPVLTFRDKTQKMIDIVTTLQSDPLVAQVVTFNPTTPQTNMVHGFLKHEVHVCYKALDQAASDTPGSLRALHRVRQVEAHEAAHHLGFRTKFEWTLGQANGALPLSDFVTSWRQFARFLLAADSGNVTYEVP